MTGTRNQALQSHTRLFQLPGAVFGACQRGWCFQLCPKVWWFKETQTMPNPHRNQAQLLSNHAQLPKAELRSTGRDSQYSPPKMWVQGFSPLGARVKYHYLCLDKRKMQDATKSITFIWILQEAEGQEMSNLLPWGWTKPKETLPVPSH